MTKDELLVSFAFLGLTTGALTVVVVVQQFMIMQLNAAVRGLANYLEEAEQ